jgi:DnaJ-class molecular chaperone|tara:strand:+ start:296 stop:745 length:450 start_codon:yes stop_codon:yes gene_type:complete
MAKKTDEPVIEEEKTSSLVDPQKKYLMDQFGDLMEQVGDGFGGPLQEELISRLQQTIADFHEEVNEMLSKLKENSEKRHDRLKEIWDNPEPTLEEDVIEKSDEEPMTDSEPKEMSEWEKKLESADAKMEGKPAKEEPPKKKGFFGRKKK